MGLAGEPSTAVGDGRATKRAPRRGVFISYRRDDSAGWAGRVFDSLQQRLGNHVPLFMDVVGIDAGSDFVRRIEDALGSSEAMLVLIGPHWVSATNDAGGLRLHDPQDFVRREVEAALAREDVKVLPVLLHDARFPRAQDLPPSLEPLTRRNALELTDTRWDYDIGRLVRVLGARRRSVRRSWLAGGLALVLALGIAAFALASRNTGRAASKPASATTPPAAPPVAMRLTPNQSIYSDGWTVVLPGELTSRSPNVDDVRQYLIDRAGAVDAGASYMQLVVQGQSSDTVEINDIHLDTVAQGPPTNWTVVRSPSAGAHDAIGIGFDLSKPNPGAQRLDDDFKLRDEPYFGSKYVTVKNGETVRFDMYLQADPRQIKAWTIELDLTINGKHKTQRLTGKHEYRTAPLPTRAAASWDWRWDQNPPVFAPAEG